jgi:hypothetical protein
MLIDLLGVFGRERAGPSRRIFEHVDVEVVNVGVCGVR